MEIAVSDVLEPQQPPPIDPPPHAPNVNALQLATQPIHARRRLPVPLPPTASPANPPSQPRSCASKGALAGTGGAPTVLAGLPAPAAAYGGAAAAGLRLTRRLRACGDTLCGDAPPEPPCFPPLNSGAGKWAACWHAVALVLLAVLLLLLVSPRGLAPAERARARYARSRTTVFRGPALVGVEFAVVEVAGSGAHVDTGRWSEGSTPDGTLGTGSGAHVLSGSRSDGSMALPWKSTMDEPATESALAGLRARGGAGRVERVVVVWAVWRSEIWAAVIGERPG